MGPGEERAQGTFPMPAGEQAPEASPWEGGSSLD